MTAPSPAIMTDSIRMERPGAPGRPMQAYFARPSSASPTPGIVVIHEIFGLNQNIRDIAERFAAAGYAALAVDLFSTANRVACMARIFHGMLIRPLTNGVVGDLRATLGYLARLPDVDAGRLGVIGFCLGGSYALQLACVADSLRAASVFYGQNPRPLESLARACPVVGSYPERDFTVAAARQLEPILEQHHIAHDIKIYPGARHSFFNDTGSAYQPAAAEDAWRRTLAFFSTHLRVPTRDDME